MCAARMATIMYTQRYLKRVRWLKAIQPHPPNQCYTHVLHAPFYQLAVRSAQPADPKVTLRFARRYLCLCVRTYHMHNSYITYIVAMQPDLSPVSCPDHTWCVLGTRLTWVDFSKFRRLLCVSQLGIRKRFIRCLLGVDRCSLSWGSGRGLLEVYQGWTDAASAGDLEEVY